VQRVLLRSRNRPRQHRHEADRLSATGPRRGPRAGRARRHHIAKYDVSHPSVRWPVVHADLDDRLEPAHGAAPARPQRRNSSPFSQNQCSLISVMSTTRDARTGPSPFAARQGSSARTLERDRVDAAGGIGDGPGHASCSGGDVVERDGGRRRANRPVASAIVQSPRAIMFPALRGRGERPLGRGRSSAPRLLRVLVVHRAI
jgi:hypothetical protein